MQKHLYAAKWSCRVRSTYIFHFNRFQIMSKVVAAIGMPTSKQLTHLKRPWCWEKLSAGGEGDDRGWDGWMPSLTQWTWVWLDSGSWWWTGRPGVLQFMGWPRVRHDWVIELNWTEPAENQYSNGTKLLKVSIVSELNMGQWCSYKIWLSFSLLTNELNNFFLFIQHLVTWPVDAFIFFSVGFFVGLD